MSLYSPAFEQAIEHVLQWEGGYVDHPDDPGGATNFGISLRFYHRFIDKSADKKTIASLSREDAIAIYHEHFWQKLPCDRLPDLVAIRFFDFSVNMGLRRASILLQRALQSATGVLLTEDGVVGKKTLEVASKAQAESICAALRSEAAGFYRLLAAKRPSFKAFLKGWLKRAYSRAS